MFSRSELEALTLQQLKALCWRYSVKPTGNSSYKSNYIVSLLALPQMAISQFDQGKGIKQPTYKQVLDLGEMLDTIGELTDEQMALIRLTQDKKWLDLPERYKQEQIYRLYRIKLLLTEAYSLINQ
ncbi:hypothetical protein I8748_02730 [Nostoc sp. CENA67]|uniref:Uncharacterized protein n=1 Tax=Amazonocrinis nigriterrae CENA67 TaxID=2794033 RepID=A0A8J7HM90_9NOST|nr:hypothetical protein [Amazonocrinis nigriterrae]MBH8561105.1 hypothetical protein [Amazonocrinis nigriterrae CENA67]